MKKIILCVLSIMLLLCLSACDSSDYKKAESLCEEERWSEAAEIFTSLGDYEDSAQRVKECNYNIAEDLFDDQKYEQAKEAFEALGDYSDSQVRVYDCNYQMASILCLGGKYEEAVPLLAQAQGHEDSIKMIHQIMFSMINDEYLPAVESAMDHLISYEETFSKEMLTALLYGSGTFTFTVDNTDPNVVAAASYCNQIEELRNRYTAIFTNELVETLDPEAQSAHTAFVNAMNFSEANLRPAKYITSVMSKFTGGTPSISLDQMTALLVKLEKAANAL